MKRRLLAWLQCPVCQAGFEAERFAGDGEDIVDGVLRCQCSRAVPIVRGIPRFLDDWDEQFPWFRAQYGERMAQLQADGSVMTNDVFQTSQRRTRQSFGYQWKAFGRMVCDFRENFLNYVYPLAPEDFAGRLGLDVGCGFGRHLANAAALGAEMVGVDFSQAIDVAAANTKQLPNVHWIQADLYRLPLCPGTFDIVYSIGVLHHLPDPYRGFQAILPMAKPGGRIAVWLYSTSRQVTNAMLESVRGITRRLPLPVLWALSYTAAIVDWGCFILPYRLARCVPGLRGVVERLVLPRIKIYAAYPFQVAAADWFDRLSAPIRHYYSREDVESWLREAGLVRIHVSPTGLYGWRGLGERPSVESAPERVVAPSGFQTGGEGPATTVARPERKRLLIITPVPESGAGYRYRVHQYLPMLSAAGIIPTVQPFYSERFFKIVHQPGHYGAKVGLFLFHVARRLAQLALGGRVDGILLYREALPIGPPVCEWLYTRRWRLPVLLDFDDAIFLGDTSNANRLVHRLKCPWKLQHVLRWSRHAMVGNAYLASHARSYQPSVSIVPTSIDMRKYQPRVGVMATSGLPVIGWIGSPTTVKYLESFAEVFRRLAARRRFRLKIVGAGHPVRIQGVEVEQRAWRLEREIEEFQCCDIGVSPLWNDAWSLGKCGFKALQFMGCGVPVVASRVGMHCDIITSGVDGLLAESEDEWVLALERLLDDGALRQRLGEAGRATVEARYSLAVNSPKFLRAVQCLWDDAAADASAAEPAGPPTESSCAASVAS